MNLWVYTLLIVALVVLLGVTLYARFAHRSRSKSLHHEPVRVRFPAAVISAAPREEEDDLDFGQIFRHAIDDSDELPPQHLPALPSQPEDRAATDYLDELQEAAAGLALLMRSTAPWKADPVVYAPEAADDAAMDGGAFENSVVSGMEDISPKAESTVEEVASEEVASHEIAEEAMAEDIIAADAIESPAPLIERRDLIVLGELVCQQFTQIDEGLDDLEALISSIEASLSAWSENPSAEEVEVTWGAAA